MKSGRKTTNKKSSVCHFFERSKKDKKKKDKQKVIESIEKVISEEANKESVRKHQQVFM